MIAVIIGFCVITLIWSGLFVVVLSIKFNKPMKSIIKNPFEKAMVEDVEEEFIEATNEQIIEHMKKNYNKQAKDDGVVE